MQLTLILIDIAILDLDQLAQHCEIQLTPQHPILCQQLERGLVDRLPRLDRSRAAVSAADDADELGLLERLEHLLTAGFIRVAQEHLVVAQRLPRRELLDQQPGLLRAPLARRVRRVFNAEEVHFQDLGRGLLDDFAHGFVRRLARLDSAREELEVRQSSAEGCDAGVQLGEIGAAL